MGGGPSETPHFIEEEMGPERGRSLLQATQQGQAEPGRETRQSQGERPGLPRSSPGLSPMCHLLHKGHSKMGHRHLRTLASSDQTSSPSPPHTPHMDSFYVSASLCPRVSRTIKEAGILRPRVGRFTHTFKIICADRDLVSQVKGDL